MNALYRIAHIEGWSYLILLFIAMPLKYFAGIDQAVRIAGSIHGFLFVILFALAFMLYLKKKLNFLSSVLIMIASLIPFATFYSEKMLTRFNR